VQNALQLKDQETVYEEGEDEKDKPDHGEGVDPAANGAEVFYQLLLFEGVAVRGFADVIELVFDALEGGDILAYLGAQLTVGGSHLSESALHLAEALLDGFQINLNGNRYGRWRRGVVNMLYGRLRGDERGNRRGCRGNIAFQHR
jgi:hypothetical protein